MRDDLYSLLLARLGLLSAEVWLAWELDQFDELWLVLTAKRGSRRG